METLGEHCGMLFMGCQQAEVCKKYDAAAADDDDDGGQPRAV
jgi:hypothetical protein